MSDFRTEADGLGRIDVPADKLWGAQTRGRSSKDSQTLRSK